MGKRFRKFRHDWSLFMGMLASIIFVVGGLFWLFPWFLSTTQNWLIAILAVFVLIPLFPVISGVLQGEGKSINGLFNEYLHTALGLFFEILYLTIWMPIIGLGIAAVIGIMLIIVTVLGTAMWSAQEYLGVGFGVSVSGDEVMHFLGITGVIVVCEAVFWSIAYLLRKKKIEDKFVDAFLSMEGKCHDFVDSSFGNE
ncbi:hypothetical protein COW94_01955 [Candidatus Peregrinibacteria bacterium CG22_combo_CG10-13_8_21_14_all_44_10]|nr:MAG: hypothetical protein AUK45_02465 [Candidatus Peregrinibacteria bacterium CG2_30_44_17]PIP66409.1 MAG: hypothetical protein COW94_01955 [Candidatus Peregrinibacteria bacterium CG22_combo_CG10-13_8_21_14_all_44_10]PIS03827.1 MAG: hypothetical protein COT83_03890 [Candidatus Peregrinibacteria bacterium CG10_big_fil_rev_8_21_14_0_10_44_7]PIX79630.1 MAG: hypothetical protein COZ35_03185 [Candidatus Peregrinibacteria bacterium CG_4_10_14_3_um_filter_44_21]